MIEPAQAAFAPLHHLLVPQACKFSALSAQIGHDPLADGIAMPPGMIGAKFRDEAPGALVPIGQHRARFGPQEHVAQQVALSQIIEPAGKQPRGGRVPAGGAPGPIEAIGRARREIDQHPHRIGRLFHRQGYRRLGIEPPGEFKQIGALCHRQRQRPRQPGQRMGRWIGLAPLLQPGQPGGADTSADRQFLAPQAGGAAAAAGLGRAAFAHGAQEAAQFQSRIGHGSTYNRINANLVTG